MFVRYFLVFFMNCFIIVEMKPFMSISQDLSIIIDCNSSFPVDKRTLNVALIEKHFDNDVDVNFKCFLHCLYNRYNWMDSYGVFQYDEMRSTLVESNLDEPSIEYLLATCTETEVEDKCNKAFTFTGCFWMESSKLDQTSLPDEDKFY